MNDETIRDALRTAGIETADPAACLGVCFAPYTVVQNMGTFRYAQSDRLAYTLMAVHCYAPLADYAGLKRLVGQVREALLPLAPDLRSLGGEGAHLVNDTFRAHETRLEYIIQKRM